MASRLLTAEPGMSHTLGSAFSLSSCVADVRSEGRGADATWCQSRFSEVPRVHSRLSQLPSFRIRACSCFRAKAMTLSLETCQRRRDQLCSEGIGCSIGMAPSTRAMRRRWTRPRALLRHRPRRQTGRAISPASPLEGQKLRLRVPLHRPLDALEACPRSAVRLSPLPLCASPCACAVLR
jgi:hypothetical protein